MNESDIEKLKEILQDIHSYGFESGSAKAKGKLHESSAAKEAAELHIEEALDLVRKKVRIEMPPCFGKDLAFVKKEWKLFSEESHDKR